MKKRVFSILFFILLNFCYADTNLSKLQNSAINNRPEYFKADDEFIVIGEIFIIGKCFTLIYNKHIWGEAKRMSGRVLLFDNEEKLVGIYGVINSQPIISKERLVFPFIEDDGNAIDFSSGIPEYARLDGEIIIYEKIP